MSWGLLLFCLSATGMFCNIFNLFLRRETIIKGRGNSLIYYEGLFIRNQRLKMASYISLGEDNRLFFIILLLLYVGK